MPEQMYRASAEPINRPVTTPRFARSRQMIECLRKEMLYSEKRPRDILFNAIELLVEDRPPMMVSQLGRESALRARLLAADLGFEFENWDLVSKAVMKTLLLAGTLLTPAGEPIPLGITAQASTVGALREGFREQSEAFLLEFLIRRLDDVTTRDHTALAHALFRQFDPRVQRGDLEDRVVILLARLSDRIVLSGDAYSSPEGARA